MQASLSPWFFSLLFSASSSVSASGATARDFLPCRPGLAIVYQFSARPGLRVEDTIRSFDAERRLCVVDRVTTEMENGKAEQEAFAREMLDDRVTSAGWLSHLEAFRPPLIVEPIRPGTRWRFNRVEYTLHAGGSACRVAAGDFPGCIVVRERALEGEHQAESVYAPGVGLILAVKAGARMEASRVLVPDVSTDPASRKAKGRSGGTARKKPSTSGR